MSLRSKSYCVKMNPIPWKRAGMNGSRLFDAQKQDKVMMGLYLNQQHNDEPLFNKATHLEVIFYFNYPKTLKKRSGSSWVSTVPDLDNLEKFLLDSIKNILITDDRIIVSMNSKKIYDKDPRVEFTLTELE